MIFGSLPKQEYLHSILSYDPVTEIFKWKVRLDRSTTWNDKYGNKIAGYRVNNHWMLCINYRKYRAYRIASVYMHGDILDISEEYHDRLARVA